ncbi:MAG: 5-oxoprolinase subunit PxpB [Vicinamibacterales bacterium]
MSGGATIVRAGDSAIVVRFEERIDPSINARALQLGKRVASWATTGVRDIVPAFHSVTVHYDPIRTNVQHLVEQLERAVVAEEPEGMADSGRSIEIPVCYGDDLGPDLSAVASWANMSATDVVAFHSARAYRVYMLGFLPGFSYLGTVDERIAVPRLATPRVHVPAGSVAIAGPQTGVYPLDTPGGWHLIGRTPLLMFDASRSRPSLLAAGDTVTFRPMNRTEYDRFSGLRDRGHGTC